MARDAQVCDLMITLHKAFEDRLQDALAMLKAAGLDVLSADDDMSVVQGVVDCSKIVFIEGLECVAYVRRMSTYSLDFPAGDPRDCNNGIDGCDCDPNPEKQPRMGKSYP